MKVLDGEVSELLEFAQDEVVQMWTLDQVVKSCLSRMKKGEVPQSEGQELFVDEGAAL